jgi:hypothetical protein
MNFELIFIMLIFIVLIIIVLAYVKHITRVGMCPVREPFETEELPAPQIIFKQMRTLLDKYDRPEVWDHATQVMDKDPGQLARMFLAKQ